MWGRRRIFLAALEWATAPKIKSSLVTVMEDSNSVHRSTNVYITIFFLDLHVKCSKNIYIFVRHSHDFYLLTTPKTFFFNTWNFYLLYLSVFFRSSLNSDIVFSPEVSSKIALPVISFSLSFKFYSHFEYLKLL